MLSGEFNVRCCRLYQLLLPLLTEDEDLVVRLAAAKEQLAYVIESRKERGSIQLLTH